jgi:hypothetical protein
MSEYHKRSAIPRRLSLKAMAGSLIATVAPEWSHIRSGLLEGFPGASFSRTARNQSGFRVLKQSGDSIEKQANSSRE